MLFLNSKRCMNKKDILFFNKKFKYTFHKSTPTTQFVQRAQIMAVTGHKSASSVAVYQRVSSKEKQVMGDIITNSVRGEQPSQLSSIMPPHSTSQLQFMPPTQNSSSSTSLVQMRANSQYTCFIVGYGRR